MKLVIETPVERGYLDVKAGFDRHLFQQLNPPFPPVKVLKFEGCDQGDTVELALNFLLFKQKWISKITEARTTADEFYFVDQGVQLPFFLKKWTHRHRVISMGIGSKIRDEISFEASLGIFNPFLYPILWLQFSFRKPIYRAVFKRQRH